jgi:uncharacterized protein
VLIILPPSETKRPPPANGAPLDLTLLSFAELNPTRRQVLAALRETSSSVDAFERLRVGRTLVEDVLRNTVLTRIPTRDAAEVYFGPLYGGFDFPGLPPPEKARAQRQVVIVSALWGVVRPTDPIPAYRLHVCARLSGIDRLEPLWRPQLNDLLARVAADSGVVLDLRSSSYQAMGRPTGMADRTVTIRVLPGPGARAAGDVLAKRLRGEIARYLVQSRAAPSSPFELASLLNDRWAAHLDRPDGRPDGWRLSVRPAA